MTNDQKQTAAKVVRWMALFVAAFLLLSLVGQFILVYRGIVSPEEGVWRPIFDIVVLLVGAVTGYVARVAEDEWTDEG